MSAQISVAITLAHRSNCAFGMLHEFKLLSGTDENNATLLLVQSCHKSLELFLYELLLESVDVRQHRTHVAIRAMNPSNDVGLITFRVSQ